MSYSSEVLADSPVLFLELDETSGTTMADSSGNGYNGSYGGSPTLGVTGLIATGTAVTFAASSSQYASVPSETAFAANGKITIEAWVKTTQSGSGSPQLVCSDDTGGARYFQFRLASGGKLEVVLFDSGGGAHTYDSAAVINDGVAHHVVATYDGAHVILYIDGSQDSSTAATFTLATASGPIELANRYSGGYHSLFLSGTLDEVALYTSALSAARISAHYTAAAVTTYTGTGKWFGLAAKRQNTSGAVDWVSDTIKIAIVSSAATIDQDTNEYWSDLDADEVSGTGYTAGGITLSSKTLTYDAASKTVRLKCADVTWSAATFSLGRYLIIYKDTGTASTSPLLGYIDAGADLNPSAEDVQAQFDATDGALRTVLS